MPSAYQLRWPEISKRVGLRDVGSPDERIARLLVLCARVVLHELADEAALGVEDGQAAADLGREVEQVELDAEPPVVALLGLFEPEQMLVQRLL